MLLSDESFRGHFAPKITRWMIAMGLVFMVLFGRVWHLQIFNGQRWRIFSESNRIQIRKIPASRGKLLDRKGQVIAESRPSFDLVAFASDAPSETEKHLASLAQLLSLDNFSVTHALMRMSRASKREPFVVVKDLNPEKLSMFLARQVHYPGFEVVDIPARMYPNLTVASHLIGYLSEIGKEDLARLKKNPDTNYELGDFWGLSGAEQMFESWLRGVNGSRPVIENAMGQVIGEGHPGDLLPAFQKQDPISGATVVLSLDLDVQNALEQAFGDKAGAGVVMNVHEGDVLALLSQPSFSPQEFTRGVGLDYWSFLRKNEGNPLFDRAVKGVYPPGSTFKMITATAALEEQVIDEHEKIFCPGHYRLGREVKRCWKRQGHGWMDMHHAIAQSCDVYFYEVGRRLGVDRIARYSKLFGLGEKSEIGINNESAGHIPTEAWKMRVYKQPWVGGETLSVAIGQGYLQTTPLQMAVATAALVNGGEVLVPRIGLHTITARGEVRALKPTRQRKHFKISDSTLKIVMDGMKAVVNEPGSTAYYTARLPNLEFAGKTGTTQVVSLRSQIKIEDHAWFIAYAPAEEPQIAVAILVEHGGSGSSTAAPIAKNVIKAYFEHHEAQ